MRPHFPWSKYSSIGWWPCTAAVTNANAKSPQSAVIPLQYALLLIFWRGAHKNFTRNYGGKILCGLTLSQADHIWTLAGGTVSFWAWCGLSTVASSHAKCMGGFNCEGKSSSSSPKWKKPRMLMPRLPKEPAFLDWLMLPVSDVSPPVCGL